MFALPRQTSLYAVLLATLMVFGLVMTQTLGMVHAITHGSSGLSLQSQDDVDAQAELDVELDVELEAEAEAEVAANAEPSGANHFLVSIFSWHQDVSDCRLYDQASHDGGLVLASPSALPSVPPRLTVAIFHGEALARWAALFDARGPPLTV